MRTSAGDRTSAAVDSSVLRLPLPSGFRFIHEPLAVGSIDRFIGRASQLDRLVERVLYSNGGSILLTGYRGVGKTSLVNQMIRTLQVTLPALQKSVGDVEIVDVHVNLPRPLTPAELMHYVLRRIRDRLVEKDLYRRLPADLRDELDLAFARTSFNMTRKLGQTVERTVGIGEVSLGVEFLKASIKASDQTKRTHTQGSEASFLGYDDKAAEYDIIRISRRLTVEPVRIVEPRPGWNPFRRSRRRLARLKVIFIFDELDKLDEVPPAAEGTRRPIIDDLLSTLKGLFTTSGICFVFVAGEDLHERWREDVGKGDSVYESVFAYDQYLQCMWEDVGDICDALAGPGPTDEYGAFRQYLEYMGRGIPRRVVRGFNDYVAWSDGRPFLVFRRKDVRRFRFFASLNELLGRHIADLLGQYAPDFADSRDDRMKLGLYYLIDWILRNGETAFSVADAVRASSGLSARISMAAEVAPRVVDRLIGIMKDGDYLEDYVEFGQRVVGPEFASAERRYRVVRRRLAEIGNFGDVLTQETAALFGGEKGPQWIGRYSIEAHLATGGMSTVYRGIDRTTGSEVAIKIPSPHVSDLDTVAGYLAREQRTLATLRHPNIVSVVDSGQVSGQQYLVTEFIDGTSLEQVLAQLGKVAPYPAAVIAQRVAGAVAYIHARGFVRVDLKPSNVMLGKLGGVYLIDLGTAVPIEPEDRSFDPTATRLVGTPPYMAPEQFAREPLDLRSDVYSWGVMFYQMLSGKVPAPSVPLNLNGDGESVALADSGAPPCLPSLVARCVAVALEERPRDFAEVGALLVECWPELAEPRAAADAIAQLVAELRNRRQAESEETHLMVVSPTMVAPEAVAPADDATRLAPSPPPPIPVSAAPGSIALSGGSVVVPPSPPGPRPAAPPPDVFLPTPNREAPNDAGAPAEPGGDVDVPVATVRLIGDDRDADRVYVLSREAATLGRSLDCDIFVDGTGVSRAHAVIRRDGDGWVILDLNTANGTLVNGAPLRPSEPMQLRDGDMIRLGDRRLEFLVPSPPPTPAGR